MTSCTFSKNSCAYEKGMVKKVQDDVLEQRDPEASSAKSRITAPNGSANDANALYADF